MIFIYAFLISGLFCMVAQILLENTKLTPGHVTSLFTVLGAGLSFLGIYPKLIEISGAGSTILISNFGHLLYQGVIEGFHQNGFLGLFSGMLTKSSLAIASAVIFAFLFSFTFKHRD
ncbi:MAG: SpoVA/SpoVAEb family sporulation membrane protein [Bacilli bacterium]|nr:SpoVA/SpoVAEb family sporulation membrane protein [Bacilli bacterium]